MRLLPVLCLLATPVLATAEPRLHLRLMTTLASDHLPRGATFRAVVIRPYEREGQRLMPAGTTVYGTVRRAHGVGLALKRERASIELDFHSYELPDGRRWPLEAHLRRVENARETVTPTGQIQGIRAAQSPQTLIGGIWHTPSLYHVPRSLLGLTGASGRIATQYSMGPIGSISLIAIRCAMFRLPEPEIRLPAGTDLQVSVTRIPPDAPTFAPDTPATLPAALEAQLAALPVTIARPNGAPAGDLINLAFRGSYEELQTAFLTAGWAPAEPMTRRSFALSYQAYAAQKGYATAPVSKLLYGGNPADAVFQKSFNTIDKRHHIRLWRTELDGEEWWLGAATHDIGVEFTPGSFSFTHKIHPRIDFERAKVTNDLLFAGCVEPAAFVARPELTRKSEGDREVTTDGRLIVLSLQPSCHPLQQIEPSAALRHRLPPAARLARRMVLESRQYVLRGNVYYWAYRGLTWKHRQRQQTLDTDD